MVTDERRRAGGERAAAPIPYIHPGQVPWFFVDGGLDLRW
jgi:hypothetical protein